jgi:hypothetical protein
MSELTGHCLCGAIQYQIKAQPQLSFLCQCRLCQRITGTGHSAEFAVPGSAVTLTGQLQCYEMQADNGNSVSSLFCPTCGNPIYKKSSGYPGLQFFHAGTLDKPEAFKPEKVFWAASGHAWDLLDPALQVEQQQ